MPQEARIIIAGLGAGAPGDITLSVWEALNSSPLIYFRTEKHPVVEWIRRRGISFSTFDHLYEEAELFRDIYTRITDTIIAAACRSRVMYAVPGHPLVAEESVRLVLERAEREGLKTKLLPAVSFLDAVFSALRLDPGTGLQIIDGLLIDQCPPLPGMAAVVTQVYSRLVASDVKLKLLEIYPPEHPVTVVQAAGITGQEKTEVMSLFEIDRHEWIDHLTSLYVPELGRGEKDQTPGRGIKKGTGRRAQGVKKSAAGSICSKEKRKGGRQPVIGQAREFEAGKRENKDLPSDKSVRCRFPLDPLIDILTRLRGENGCPWDREQDHRSLKKFLLEETYEVLEALDEENMYKICEELGDLLLQIVFHAQIAWENRHFDMNNVISDICEKMMRRHPHVFGSATVKDAREVILNWERIKAGEKGKNMNESLVSGVPRSMPALMRAFYIQDKAAEVGFDWPDYRGALEKTHEELEELKHVISDGDKRRIESELGDLLFSVVNLARLLGVNPEAVLTGTSGKFTRRFGHVEKKARDLGKNLSQCALSEMDKWWEEAKKEEKK